MAHNGRSFVALHMRQDKEPSQTDVQAIPIVEETVEIEKRAVETGVVRVRTHVNEILQHVREELLHEIVEVERVPIGKDVAVAPAVRSEGDVTIVPVLEERLVIRKQLVLKEEIHLRRSRRRELLEEDVPVRSMEAVVEREKPHGS